MENFGPRWPTEDGLEVLKKCHGQAVCCMPKTYASREASTLKKLRKQEDLRENRGWWKSGTLVTQASQIQPQESSEQEAEIRIFPGAGMALQVILSPEKASLRQCCSVFILLSAPTNPFQAFFS